MGFQLLDGESNQKEKSLDYKFKNGEYKGVTVYEVITHHINYIKYLVEELDFLLDDKAFAYYMEKIGDDDFLIYKE